MLGMGFKLLFSDNVGNVERRTWSKGTFTPRNEAPGKREVVNIEGGKCVTECGYANTVAKANTDDCKTTYEALYNKATAFTLDPRMYPPYHHLGF